MNIISVVEQIKNGEIVLPAIQREFIWPVEKTEKLFDSILRGYPIGIILLWETFNNIQYRSFPKDFREGTLHKFRDNDDERRLKLVLDGQQRLQSLYLGLYGSFNGKYLYFDVLSGRSSEDFEEEKFLFYFETPKEIKEWNKEDLKDYVKNKSNPNEDFVPRHHVKAERIIKMDPMEIERFKERVRDEYGLIKEDYVRLGLNLGILQHRLANDENILKIAILDENKPRDSLSRLSESDVLEAFVRVNRQGTPLTRSDLIFSMLKLSWSESAESIPEFAKKINEGNSFDLDVDFVIRCLFAVSDLGTRFDIDVLRRKSNIDEIRKNFGRCCDAICSTIDFIQEHCWLSSSKLIRGYFNLIPIVYYLFNIDSLQVPNEEIDRVRKSLYLLGFTAPFSRYADSRLWRFIRERLLPLKEEVEKRFPLEGVIYDINYWENFDSFGSRLLQKNIALTHHLVQRRLRSKAHYRKNEPQMDHIFPKSILEEKGFDEAEINHFANFWVLAKNKNQNKSNKHPKDYFKDVGKYQLQNALIERELLDYRKYKSFLRTREKKILNYIGKELKLSNKDFKVLDRYEED